MNENVDITNDLDDLNLKAEKESPKKPRLFNWESIVSFILCLAMIAAAVVAFFVPIVTLGVQSLTPYNIIASIDDKAVSLGESALTVSYYLYKVFFYLYIAVIAVSFFIAVYLLLTKNKKLSKKLGVIMQVLAVFLLIYMLIGMNYVNTYKTIKASLSISTPAPVFAIIAVSLLAIKFMAGFFIKTDKDELKDSSLSFTVSFVQTFITLSSLFFPLYIFQGTSNRLRGIDILLGKNDVMDFLPMASTFKIIILVMTIAVSTLFLLGILFHVISRKLSVRFIKFTNFVSLVAIIVYALMGLNYMLVYADAKVYSTVFAVGMSSYSYGPLALLTLFWIGMGFTKLAYGKVKVEYKVYADNGTPNTSGAIQKTEEEKIKAVNEEEDKNGVLDPIPAFSEIDGNVKAYEDALNERMEHDFPDISLPKLVAHVIEYARNSKERLSYGPMEVKTFIAGLAASRLSVLQGMSGTGKTSLPKIFMEAIDGFCDIVAIESSWRDKNELLGYYNEFNKKYTPKTFTQFLYKAALNKEIPTFIVLDEMNLSRIEYYFSDFLSLMEARENLRHIKLFDVQLYPKIDDRKEYLSLRNGHTIDIPTNVWFIGTANRDESTFEISDKVYDRAQTMNFDKRAPKIEGEIDPNYPKKFVPYSALRKLFEESKAISFNAESYEPIQKVEKLLRPYKISFGNRVLKQIEEFVNAYVSCSEISSSKDTQKFIHEAVDCIIFSKVVRKLELKQINDFDTLIEEFEALNLAKSVEFLSSLAETI